MNLPIINQLLEDESTYIAFTKGLLDLDEAIMQGTEYYFSKVVALNLPNWAAENNFYIDLADFGMNSVNHNPNIVIPKMIQHYMENLLRQDNEYIAVDSDQPINEITELAFYKMLHRIGMSKKQIQDSIVFCNDIVTSNFTKVENNNGWGEIICQIPNKCRVFKPAWRTVDNIRDIVTTKDEWNALTDSQEQKPFYDNNSNQYLMDEFTEVLDINNSVYDDVEKSEFSFNVLLLFYRDKAGVDKLHGINFIYPFENKNSYWDQVRFTQKTNIARNIGYQFIFNLKTCNNESSLIKVYEQYEHVMWWEGFNKTLTGLNSFLENKMREMHTEISTIPHIQGD